MVCASLVSSSSEHKPNREHMSAWGGEEVGPRGPGVTGSSCRYSAATYAMFMGWQREMKLKNSWGLCSFCAQMFILMMFLKSVEFTKSAVLMLISSTCIYVILYITFMKEVGLFGVINSLVHCNLKLVYLIFSISLIFSKLIEVSYTTATLAK